MYTLLDTCLDRLDIFEFLSHVEDGLKDHYDIKVSTITCKGTCTITRKTMQLWENVQTLPNSFNPEEKTGRFLNLLVYTTSEKFENEALFLRGLGLRPLLSVTKTELFEDAPPPGEIWKRRLSVFTVYEKHFEKVAFRKRGPHDDHVMIMWWSCDFPDRVFLKHKSKMAGDCGVFKLPWRIVDGKYLMRLQFSPA